MIDAIHEVKDVAILWSEGFVQDYGILGLFVFSFTEAFINPIPVAPILAFGIAVGMNPYLATFVALVANLLGAMVGFFLGKNLGHPVCVKLFGVKKMDRAEKFFLKYAEIGVFMMAFTPLPFKVATWAAGVFEMRFFRFMMSAVLGRTSHFIVVFLVTVSGLAFLKFLTG
jgi:membrane protein YqaA with SNARE-associated domain